MTRYRMHAGWVAVSAMAALLSGCADYELLKDNATFMDGALKQAAEKAVAALKVDRLIAVPGDATVAVVNMENPVDLDAQPNAKIHDALVAALVAAGATPVERDDDVLVRLVNEATGTLSVAAITRNEGEGRSFQWDARAESRKLASPVDEEEPVASHSAGKEAYEKRLPGDVIETGTREEIVAIVPAASGKTEIPAASKILAFRVKECGIRYGFDTGDIDYAKQGYVRRNGRVNLNVRLVDTRTGRVDQATTVDETISDYVRKTHLSALEKHLYKDFNHLYPAVKAGGGGGRRAGGVARPQAAADIAVSRGLYKNAMEFGGTASGPVVQYVRQLGVSGIAAHKLGFGIHGFHETEKDGMGRTETSMRIHPRFNYAAELVFADAFRFEILVGGSSWGFAAGVNLRFRLKERFHLCLGYFDIPGSRYESYPYMQFAARF